VGPQQTQHDQDQQHGQHASHGQLLGPAQHRQRGRLQQLWVSPHKGELPRCRHEVALLLQQCRTGDEFSNCCSQLDGPGCGPNFAPPPPPS
jgi:hypothetical protein